MVELRKDPTPFQAGDAALVRRGLDNEVVTLGEAATLDVGTTAGTVAAGNHTHGVATTGAAGFLPALPGNTTTFLRGDGTFAAPPAGGGGGEAPTFGNVSTLSGDWRGEGAETLLAATTALQAEVDDALKASEAQALPGASTVAQVIGLDAQGDPVRITATDFDTQFLGQIADGLEAIADAVEALA